MNNRGSRTCQFLMVKKYSLIVLSLVFLLSACKQETLISEATPTSFPLQVPVQRITTAAPIPISLENLAANPDFYIGATLQISGQFHRLPRLVCEGTSYPSPAKWALEENGFMANASGMDAQMRSLVEEGQEIKVEGRWLKYEGSIGCEGQVQDETIWYLSVDRVLDPYPLVRLQTTPAEGTGTASEDFTRTPETITEASEQVIFTDTPLPITTATAVPTFTATSVISTTVPTTTITPIPSMTSTLASGSTPTGTPIGLPTATVDQSGEQATSTVTATPSASTTPSNATIVEKGNINTEDLIISNLGTANIDKWSLDLVAGDAITITVAPATSTDVLLSLFDSNNIALVNEQNFSSAGMPETITNVNISNPGIHTVQVSTANGTQTDYALMFMDSDSYSFIFKGMLDESIAKSGNVNADSDHFWFFHASNSDSVSFVVTPNNAGDPYIELYNPQGDRILTIDETGEGEAETLDNYTLLDGGMYGIRVAEFDFQPMAYSIEILS
jgi:hypothetical protein